MKDCAILINTCDNYEDAWKPFFKILKAEWPECTMPIYVNTESKTCESDEFEITTLNVLPGKNKSIEWGERLIDALNRIDTKYVLFLLEDYFLQESVKTNIIDDCIRWMDEDDNIATFLLVSAGLYARPEYKGNIEKNEKYPGFGLREKTDKFLLCAGPGIWRREDLIKLTKPFESPWIWEGYGSLRAAKYPKEFYCRKLNGETAFVYDVVRGGAIHRGLWVGCSVRPLLEKHRIELDLNIRGVDEDWLEHPPVVKTSLSKRICNLFKRIRSLYF